MYLKVNEIYGGPIMVNMAKVEQVTDNGGNAKLWYTADDADALLLKESFSTVESMMDLSLNGYPGVVSAESVEFVKKAPANVF